MWKNFRSRIRKQLAAAKRSSHKRHAAGGVTWRISGMAAEGPFLIYSGGAPTPERKHARMSWTGTHGSQYVGPSEPHHTLYLVPKSSARR